MFSGIFQSNSQQPSVSAAAQSPPVEVVLPAGLPELLQRFPLPENYQFAYGTAGFRTLGSRIPAVAARIGALLLLKARLTGNEHAVHRHKRMGVMITASHNPHEDNGLKVVDLDGGMLSMAWEGYATALANARTVADYGLALSRIAADLPQATAILQAGFMPSPTPEELTVIVGFDTRESAPAITEALRRSLAVFGIAKQHFVDLGTVSTPVVHHHVYYGTAAPDWHGMIAETFRKLIQHLPKTKVAAAKRHVVVDCANGVAALSIPLVLEKLAHHKDVAASFDFTLACTDVTHRAKLNDHCGADFAQKNRVPAEAMYGDIEAAFEKAEGKTSGGANLGVYAVDGDADRVVAFQVVNEAEKRLLGKGRGVLLDGDRIIVLIAMALKSLLDVVTPALGEPAAKVGVVQTAYANGASTKYIADVLGLSTELAATGVKYVHHAAINYDIGIYFEANGHGTMLIDENSRHPGEHRTSRLRYRLEHLVSSHHHHHRHHHDVHHAAAELLRFGTLLSQSCGDGIANVFVIEYCLRRLGLTFDAWVGLYADLPSRQVKFTSSNPRVVKTVPNETRATEPAGLQEAIDAAVAAVGGPQGRAFVRPSGTEPIVRVYAEAETEEQCEALTGAVLDALKKFAP